MKERACFKKDFSTERERNFYLLSLSLLNLLFLFTALFVKLIIKLVSRELLTPLSILVAEDGSKWTQMREKVRKVSIVQ